MPDPARIVRYAAQEEVGARDVVALWTREAGLSLEEALRRVPEVLFIAVADGAPVGVCTVYLEVHQQLRLPMWHLRAFVAQARRRGEVGVRLLIASRDHLAARFAQGIDRRGAGLVVEVEHEGLRRRFTQARMPHLDFTFVGVNAFGDHVRVHYFPGATVQGST